MDGSFYGSVGCDNGEEFVGFESKCLATPSAKWVFVVLEYAAGVFAMSDLHGASGEIG